DQQEPSPWRDGKISARSSESTDEADEALRTAEEKQAAMQAIDDRARVAARRC
ncbi:hypothetical protein A2U01_0106524, partial [Trifolium medium]|nr:hypothetical protein [Trifolium medium]